MNRVWCELALVSDRPEADVLIGMADGRIDSVAVGAAPGDAIRLAGFTVPGLANTHSHAFHRALRSRTQIGRGSFWTWRDLMYRAADRLNPDTYHRLARAVFAEMAMAGVACVGEFHYLHHRPAGQPYDDANVMGEAMLAAATQAGIRITLLDTLYLHGGLGSNGYTEPVGQQRRFSDGTAAAWIDRIERLTTTESQRLGVAVHSVRAVDRGAMLVAGEWAAARRAPLHAHVSEQVAENEVCIEHHGTTPVQVLADAGLLGERFSAVHATHLTGADIERLAAGRATVVMCPTTERDLGDGIGPTDRLADAGVPIALGSDSHAVIDLFEEARAVELDQRLHSRSRGIHTASDLLAMAGGNGHHSLGWLDAGAIEVGKRADLVTIGLDSVRTAGTGPDLAVETAIFAATSADVTNVHVDGRLIVADGHHLTIDVAQELDTSIKELLHDD